MMIRFLTAVLVLAATISGAAAQSDPGLRQGQVPSAAQWNSYFAAKQDVLGYTPLNIAGGTMTGPLITVASGTGAAGFRIPPGTAPTSPVNGDLWTTSAGIFARINGGTVGPLVSGSGFGTAAFVNTGNSGHTLPFLDIPNTWSAIQTFSSSPLVPTATAGDSSTKAASTAFVTALGTRTKLLGTTTFYVSTTGSNANSCLTSLLSCATLQYVYDLIATSYDMNAQLTFIQLADGTYTLGLNALKNTVGQNGIPGLVVQGNCGTPSNTVVSTTNANAIAISSGGVGSQGMLQVQCLKVQTAVAGEGLFAEGGGAYLTFSNIEFGAVAGDQIGASHNAVVECFGNYKISGGGNTHIAAGTGGIAASHTCNVTISNAPAYVTGFASAITGGKVFVASQVFTNGNTVTGPKFSVIGTGSQINPGPGDTVNYLPGSVPGTALYGGLYSVWVGPCPTSLVSSNVTLSFYDCDIIADATGAPFTITLPAVTTTTLGVNFKIRKYDSTANVVTIAADVTNSISPGGTHHDLKVQDEAVGLVSYTTNWNVFSTSTPSGVSGGLAYYSSTYNIASSNFLAANLLMIGGGAGNPPITLGSPGTTTTVLHGNASGAPSFAAVTPADLGSVGTGVATALGVNIGTAGSFVVNGGVLGTPSSGVGTNITGVNAATLGGATFAAPGPIGGTTRSTGAFTTVSMNGGAATTINIMDSTAGGTVLQQFTASGASKGYIGYVPSSVDGMAILMSGGGIGLQFQDSNSAAFFSGPVAVPSTFVITTIPSETAADSTVCSRTSDGLIMKGTGALGICMGTSGAQFKRAFAPMVAGLSELMQIDMLNYRYLPGHGDGGARMQYGPTAQDVEAVLPDLAGHNAEGDTINYDSGALFFIGLRAIQQLKADNDNMASRLRKLESR